MVDLLPVVKGRHGIRRGLRRLNLRGWCLPLGGLLILESTVRLGVIPAWVMPPPSDVLLSFAELARGDLWPHILASGLRVLAGFTIGSLLGLLVGSLVGLRRDLEAWIDPLCQALRAVPGLAWVPLLLIWLGIDESAKITLIAIGAFFPVYLNLVAGIRNVDHKLIELGALYPMSRLQLARRIVLPAASPYLFTGLRSALSMSWLCVVAAELLAATRGIGYLLTDGRETSRPDLVLVAIITLAIMGKLTDSLLKGLERRALAWRDNFPGEGQ